MLLLHLCRKPRSLPSARLDPLLISVSKKVCGKDNWKLILTATTTTFFCNFQERELHTISLVTIYPLSSVSLLLSPTTVLNLVRKYCNSSSLNLTFPISVGNSAAASPPPPPIDQQPGRDNVWAPVWTATNQAWGDPAQPPTANIGIPGNLSDRGKLALRSALRYGCMACGATLADIITSCFGG